VVYDRIGLTYGMSRRSDPRIAAVIRDALGDSGSVVNVGAGVGGYEPTDRRVVAVEPSAAMIAQRPASAAPVVQASAEALPFSDKSADAALAVNTVHHWTDLAAGLRELRRVARKRVVIFLRIPHLAEPFWLADYLPALEPVAMMRGIGGMIDRELGPGGAVSVPFMG
jgi:SAM-dependent methyltransferase